MSKNLFTLFFSVLISLVIFEGALHATKQFWASRLGVFDPLDFIVSEAELRKIKRDYDFELGWKPKNRTKLGEREISERFGRPLLTTFGDSFVYGDEVGGSETWQSHLAKLFGRDVYNFGVAGYGTDQALLRFRQDGLNAPFVGLGITLENINRVMNTYRRFYSPKTGLPLTKPKAVFADGQISFNSNPIKSADELDRLRDLSFIEELGKNDIWFSKRKAVSFIPKTPYFLNLFYSDFWQRTSELKLAEANFNLELWQDPEATKIMRALLNQFSKDAASRGSKLIVIILPYRHDVDAARAGKQERLEELLKICREEGLLCFNGIGYIAAELANKDEATIDSIWAPGMHLTDKGNSLIARGLYSFLQPIMEKRKHEL